MTVIAGISLALTAIWFVRSYQVSPRAFLDLDVYRIGVRAWWQGHDMYGVLPDTVIGSSLPFTYPPVTALVLGPLAALSWPGSIVVMMILSLLSLCCLAHVTIRSVRPGVRARDSILCTLVPLPLWLLAEPVRDTFWFGQVNLLLVALVAVDCLVVTPRWPRGLLIGIAAAIKLTPAVFLLFFLLRKDFRAAVTMTVSALAVTAIGFVMDGSASVRYWFGSSGGAHAVGDPAFITNQSVNGALHRLGLTGPVEVVLWLGVCALALLFAAIIIGRPGRPAEPALAMVVTGAVGLLASPISWGHHWVYVVPAVIVMVARGLRRRHPGWLLAAAGTAVVFVVAPFGYLPLTGPVSALQQLASDSFALLTLLLLAVLALVRPARRTPPAAGQDEPVTDHELENAVQDTAGVAPAGLLERARADA